MTAEQTMTIILPANLLLAVAQASAKDDPRQYINGVAVQRVIDGVCLVATDGYVLVAAHVPMADLPPDWPDDIIIPRALLDGLKAKDGDVALTAGAPDADGRRLLTVQQHRGHQRADYALDGRFPDWRPKIPRNVSGETAQFDLELLARLQKAAEIASAPAGTRRNKYASRPVVTIGHNGPAPALVDFGKESMVGVILPHRSDPPEAPPAWVFET